MNRSFQSEQTCRVVIIEHSLQIIQKIFQLGGGKLIYDQIKREVDILSRKYDKLQQQLLKMPEGELLCAKNGDYTKWYLHNDKTLSYISKSIMNIRCRSWKNKYIFWRNVQQH